MRVSVWIQIRTDIVPVLTWVQIICKVAPSKERVNPFTLNGISHSSQLDQSIFILRVGGIFQLSKF